MARTKQTIRGKVVVLASAATPKRVVRLHKTPRAKPYRIRNCGKRANRRYPLDTSTMRIQLQRYNSSKARAARLKRMQDRLHLASVGKAKRGDLCVYTTKLWKRPGYSQPRGRVFVQRRISGQGKCKVTSAYCAPLKRCLPKSQVCWGNYPLLAMNRRKNRRAALIAQNKVRQQVRVLGRERL